MCKFKEKIIEKFDPPHSPKSHTSTKFPTFLYNSLKKQKDIMNISLTHHSPHSYQNHTPFKFDIQFKFILNLFWPSISPNLKWDLARENGEVSLPPRGDTSPSPSSAEILGFLYCYSLSDEMIIITSRMNDKPDPHENFRA